MPTTITREQLESKVFEVLATFGPEPEDITAEATLESLDVDSLDLAELSQIVEDEYGVKIEGDDMPNIKTVGDAVDYIVARTQ